MWSLIMPKTRHLVALAVFLPFLVLVQYLIAKNTDAYDEAARFVAEDVRVVAVIGTVQKTDLIFWKEFEFTGSNANFSIKAKSGKGTFVVDVRLHCVAGVWRVKTANIYGPGNTITRIVA